MTKPDKIVDLTRAVHYWEDGPETEDGVGTTCMLLDGHDGPHIWSRDDEIGVRFAPLETDHE